MSEPQCGSTGQGVAVDNPIRKEVVIGDARLLLGDCLSIMPTLEPVDAVVTDPPYGIGESAGKAKTRTSGLASSLTRAHLYLRDYGEDDWDNQTADQAVQLAISKAKHCIIFGGNYYDLPPTSCWLIWDKKNGASDFADCEMAWTNLSMAVRKIDYLWNGCLRRERHIAREHPTQKPLGVMVWCLEKLPATATIILDPFMGSGTTGVACAKLGRKFIGIEQEEKYFDIACERIRKAYDQPDLFIAPPEEKPKQKGLL